MFTTPRVGVVVRMQPMDVTETVSSAAGRRSKLSGLATKAALWRKSSNPSSITLNVNVGVIRVVSRQVVQSSCKWITCCRLTGPADVQSVHKHSKMLATQSRLLNASRPSTRPFVASSSSVARAPTVAANAGVKLAPLIDSLKADQLKDNLPQVR